MSGLIITFQTDSFTIDFNGESADRAKARIKLNDIRSLVDSTDDKTVNIIFSNGEIYGFDFNNVESVDGDTNINTQDILFSKFEAKLFV